MQMIKLLDILNEVKVNIPIKNNLKELESIKNQISSEDNTNPELLIKAAEYILPIAKVYFPENKEPEKIIGLIKQYIKNPTPHPKLTIIGISNTIVSNFSPENPKHASLACFAALGYSVSDYNSWGILVLQWAIEATKEYFKLNEIKINIPINISEKCKIHRVIAKKSTEFFRADYMLDVVDIGQYYTFIPSGSMSKLYLFPKDYFEIWRKLDREYLEPEEIKHMKELLNTKGYEIIK